MTVHPPTASVAVGVGLSAAALTAFALLLGSGTAAVIQPLPQAALDQAEASLVPIWDNEHAEIPSLGL